MSHHVDSSGALLCNILCNKWSSLWSAKLSKEECRELGVMEFGRVSHGE